MYFDFTATTKIDDEVLQMYIDISNKYYANTTSLHLLGQKCNNIYEQMKNTICDIFSVDANVIFTSNATEANNIAIKGILANKKGKIITTKIEHPSVYEVYKSLENDYDVVYLDVDENGIIDLDMLKNEMNKDVILVSVMWVNNITGSIQPINEIIKIVKEYKKCKLHVDCVQGICKIKPDFDFSQIDLFTLSAHKFYGPKGIGALICKKNISLKAILHGSNAQYGLKPGTFDLALVCCLTKALKKYNQKIEEHYKYVKTLNEYIINNLSNDNIMINSNKNASPYILNISFKNILGETAVHKLEQKDIYVSTGSSCSSKLSKKEKTIYAMFKDDTRANNTVRISLSHVTTLDEVKMLVDALNQM